MLYNSVDQVLSELKGVLYIRFLQFAAPRASNDDSPVVEHPSKYALFNVSRLINNSATFKA